MGIFEASSPMSIPTASNLESATPSNLLKRKATDRSKARPAKKPRVPKPKNPPATSALPPIDDKRRNLTLADWMMVYAYIDSHPDANQGEIVKYFRTHPSGQLIFDQSTLSRKLQDPQSCIWRAAGSPRRARG